MVMLRDSQRQAKLHNPDLKADQAAGYYNIAGERPEYYKKYGYVDFKDGMPHKEYTRYMKMTAGMRERYGETRKPARGGTPPMVGCRKRSCDTRHEPLREPTRRYVNKDTNIHILISILIGLEEHRWFSQEGWDSLNEDDKFDYYYNASLNLVEMVSDMAKKLKDINIVKFKEGDDRKKYLILWKSMATHLRYKLRRHGIAIKWDAFKHIADHNPRSEYRKLFRATQIQTYEPKITPADVTILDVSDKKYYGWRNKPSTLSQYPAYWSGYARWIKRTIPIAKESENRSNAHLVNYKRSDYVSVKDQWELLLDFMKKMGKTVYTTNKQKCIDFYSDCVSNGQFPSEEELKALARKYDIYPYFERLYVPKNYNPQKKTRQVRQATPMFPDVEEKPYTCRQDVLDAYPIIESEEKMLDIFGPDVDDLFRIFDRKFDQDDIIELRLTAKGMI